jgi:hypothetical protein
VGSAEEKRSHSEGVERTGAQSSDQEPRRGSLPGALAGAAGAAAAGGGAGALARDQLRAARQSDRSGGGDDSGTSDQPAEGDEPAGVAALDVFEQRLPTSSVSASESVIPSPVASSPSAPGTPASTSPAPTGPSPASETISPAQRAPSSAGTPQAAPAPPTSPGTPMSSPASVPPAASPAPAPTAAFQPPPPAGVVPPADPSLATVISTPVAPQFPTSGIDPVPGTRAIADAEPVPATRGGDPDDVTRPSPEPAAGYVDAPVDPRVGDTGVGEAPTGAVGETPPSTDPPGQIAMPPGPDADAHEPPVMPPALDTTPPHDGAVEAPAQDDVPGASPPISAPVEPPAQIPDDDPADQTPPPLDDPAPGGPARYFYNQSYPHPADVYGESENSFVRSIDNAHVDVYANETIYVVTRPDGSQVIAWLATDNQGRPILNQSGNDVPDLVVDVAPNGSYEIQTYPISHVSGVVVSLDLEDYPDRVDPDSLNLPYTESFDFQSNLKREYPDGTVKTFFRSWDNVGAVSIKYPDDIVVYVEANGNTIAQDTSGAPVLISNPPPTSDDDAIDDGAPEGDPTDESASDDQPTLARGPFEPLRPGDLLNIDPGNLTPGGRIGQPPANTENAEDENAPAGPIPAGPLPSLPLDSPITDRGNLPTLPTLPGQSTPDPAADPRLPFEPLQPSDLQNIDPGNLTPFGKGFGSPGVNDVPILDTTPAEDDDDLES